MNISALPFHKHLRHPRTGRRLQAVHVDRHGRARWPVMGGGETEDAAKAAAEEAASDKATADAATKAAADKSAADKENGDLGFPKETPVAEMSPGQQAAYWKHQSRKHESTWKGLVGDRKVDDVKADLGDYDRLRQEKLTPSEKAIEDAKKAGRDEATRNLQPKFVAMAFDTALAHVAEADRKELIDTIDLSKFITDTGDVDTAKVSSVAKKIAPAGTGTGGRIDYGAGRRPATDASGVSAGAAMFAESRKKKTP